jgi:predicted AAA+ superfamily ATPase
VGKSTLLHALADSVGRIVIDCDDPATRTAVRNDPGRFVTGSGPVLIDEYQHVPELLDAIKAELNRDLSPGRYLAAAIVLYSGSLAYTHEDGTMVLPLDALWTRQP